MKRTAGMFNSSITEQPPTTPGFELEFDEKSIAMWKKKPVKRRQ
jgi:hypothetical protein